MCVFVDSGILPAIDLMGGNALVGVSFKIMLLHIDVVTGTLTAAINWFQLLVVLVIARKKKIIVRIICVLIFDQVNINLMVLS